MGGLRAGCSTTITLNKVEPLRRTALNRVFAAVYTCAIFALLYHHAQTLLDSKTLVSFSVSLLLLISDIVLAFMWTTTQSFRMRPVHRREYPENLKRSMERNEFPALDVFICTADPYKEPPMSVVNTALSVMAYDYPTEKISVYVSDDGGSPLTLFACMEAAKFSSHWLSFCRKHDVMERNPDVYFASDHFHSSETDNIKGGSSVVHEMQQRAQKNFDASKDRSLPMFGVGVTYIDESAYHSVPACETDKAIEDIRSIVSNLAPPVKELHVFPIEGVFPLDSLDGRERLNMLLDSVSDATGKEDLMLHLRMLALQKVASENGYNRLVLGLCTSRIACHVISATVKGQGYSLPADIQYVDARWDVPVVLPLRDCLAPELNMLCHIDGLQTVEFSNGPCSGINGLVSSFVKLLQEENPSRECTIVRTAGKLTPFHFNRIPELNDSNVPLATRRRQKRFNLKPNESISSESFCSLCFSPLSKSDMSSLSSFESCRNNDILGAVCCSSCEFEIIPKDSSSMEHFYSVLPQPLLDRAKNCSNGSFSSLRKQIQDCLLSESEDET